MTIKEVLFYVNREANGVLIRLKSKFNPSNIAIKTQNRLEEAKKKKNNNTTLTWIPWIHKSR